MGIKKKEIVGVLVEIVVPLLYIVVLYLLTYFLMR
jgi:hypothetical protein